jgi:hypothetical protein
VADTTFSRKLRKEEAERREKNFLLSPGKEAKGNSQQRGVGVVGLFGENPSEQDTKYLQDTLVVHCVLFPGHDRSMMLYIRLLGLMYIACLSLCDVDICCNKYFPTLSIIYAVVVLKSITYILVGILRWCV